MDHKEAMREKKDWDKRYDENDLPWDSGRPDTSLTNLVARWPDRGGRVLEIGCGTGTNAVWLAERGFEVTALDISTSAIVLAEKRCAEHEAQCRLLRGDFLTCALPGQYDLLFDRGCFHSLSGQEGGEDGRRGFVRKAATCLKPGGLWFSLMGNKDQVADEKGPPRMSAEEICASVEPDFEVLRLESVLRDTGRDPAVPLRFWQCLMRVR